MPPFVMSGDILCPFCAQIHRFIMYTPCVPYVHVSAIPALKPLNIWGFMVFYVSRLYFKKKLNGTRGRA